MMLRCLPLAVVLAISVSASEALPDLRVASREMTAAALNFWNSLSPEQQAKAGFTMDGEERLNWHFTPKARKGLPFKEMTPAQRHLATAFFSTGMSQRGYMEAVSIMSLEQILFDLENKAPHRDAELYYFSVFGTPDEKKPWAWRVEGHHLSINFTLVSGIFVATAPTFFGTNPAEILSGPRKGQRVLAVEQDVARKLIVSLNDEQKKAAIILPAAPKDILTAANKKADIGAPAGLSADKLTEEQKTVLAGLIKHYASRFRPEMAKQEWERIEKAGFNKVFFAWAGPTDVGQAHYYRIHGPTFLIEYDNIQNNANHIHSVWRDLENDFGGDILAKHYAESHK